MASLATGDGKSITSGRIAVAVAVAVVTASVVGVVVVVSLYLSTSPDEEDDERRFIALFLVKYSSIFARASRRFNIRQYCFPFTNVGCGEVLVGDRYGVFFCLNAFEALATACLYVICIHPTTTPLASVVDGLIKRPGGLRC